MRAPRLLCDREYLPFLLEEIEKAKREIAVRIFLIDPGREKQNPVLKILAALSRTQKRGVRIKIYTDSIFRFKASGRRLQEAAGPHGLKIIWDTHKTTLHEKTVTIDGRLIFIGSHNWTLPSLQENHELSVKFNSLPLLIKGETLSVRSSKGASLPPKIRLDALGFTKQFIDDIDRAKREIMIATFDIDESSSPYEFGTRVASALIRAKSRGLKVRVLLEASQMRVPETGDILYQLRGLKKANDLVHQGVEVYYDTTFRLLHAKACVIDHSIVYVGSQNLEIRKDVTALETTARIHSKRMAGGVTRYLESAFRTASPYFYEPSALVGMPLPVSFLEEKGILGRLYSAKGFTLFPFYIKLLKLLWAGKLNEFRERFTVNWNFGYRLSKLKRRFHVLDKTYHHGRPEAGLDRIILLDPVKQSPFKFPRRDYFILPDAFFDLGWLERLRVRDMFVYFIHLAQSQNSRESPYWSMRNLDIAKSFGIDSSTLSHATVALERWNLIEVVRDPKITVKNVVKKPNRYRVNEIWNPAEHELIKKKMLEELSLSPAILKEAETLARVLNQDHDLDVIRKFLLLIDRYGLRDTRKAARLTARFKHQFALRQVNHTAAILRNWSQGIYK